MRGRACICARVIISRFSVARVGGKTRLEDDIVTQQLAEVGRPGAARVEVAPALAEDEAAGVDAPEDVLKAEGTQRSIHRAECPHLGLETKEGLRWRGGFRGGGWEREIGDGHCDVCSDFYEHCASKAVPSGADAKPDVRCRWIDQYE